MFSCEGDTNPRKKGMRMELKSNRERISNRSLILVKTFDRVIKPEDQIRIMIDKIPAHAWTCRTDGTVEFINQRWLDYTGLTIEQSLDWGWQTAIHQEDLEELMNAWSGALASEEEGQKEARVRHMDGEYRWFLFRFAPVRDEHGEVVRWCGASADIEILKRAERQAPQDERKLHQGADAMPQALVLRDEIEPSLTFEEIVGSSERLRNVLSRVTRVASTDSTVLILGETGTGKELVARAIHKQSSRSGRAFIRVNCAAIPTSLIASELFGHEKGAFTGAMQRRQGRFELADGGTIFLDEIGELPMDTQVALLRVLQEREIERVGGSQSISLNVRVLAATNRNLLAEVEAGRFREDLYYRLNVFPIQMPPLRQRVDDILPLVERFVDRYAKKNGKKIKKIDKMTLELLERYKWPGNIRELQNLVERGVILCDSDTFSVDEEGFRHEQMHGSMLQPVTQTRLLLGDDQQRQLIEAALAESKGRVAGPFGAATRLGVPRQTLESKIASLGINKHRYKVA